MAIQLGTLQQLAVELGNVLARLSVYLRGNDFPDTLARLGIAFPTALLEHPQVVATRNGLVSAATELPEGIELLLAAADAEDLQGVIDHGLELLNDANDLIGTLSDLPDALDAARAAFPEITDAQFAEFAANFPRKLLDLLVSDALDVVPAVGAALTLAGVIERISPQTDADPALLDVEGAAIRYDRITTLLGDPEEHFRTLYDWGLPAFDGTKLLPALYDLLARLGLPAAYHPPTESSGTLLEAYVVDVTPNTAADPPGLDFRIVAPFGGSIDEAFPLPHPSWTGHFSASGAFATQLTGSLRPPLALSVSLPSASFEGSVEVSVLGEPAEPFVLLGKAGGNRLEVKTVRFAAGLTVNTAAGLEGAEPQVEGAIEGGRILVDGSEGDGFISKILSGVQIDSNFDVGIAWSMATGVRFDGSSTLEIMLPAHVDLGPFSVSEIFLVAGLEGAGIPVELSAALALRLGPLQASVRRIGFTANVAFPGTGGNAGPAQIDFAFKPPTGVGLVIDAQGIKGGGFVDIDLPNHRYFGILQLQIQETIEVTAIAVINTRMPDGSAGFSLLILISADFQPIQLGMGFTLNGVGGLLGLNRTVDVEVLRNGLRSRAFNSVLFPEDPIANAPQIISDLTGIFPVFEGRFVIGPMARIGYGTPTLITIDLGLVIELPDPVRIVLLGVLRALLPQEDAPLVEIQVNFLGVIDFGKGELAFDASLFDSRLLAFTLSGDMAVRLRWGGDPMFLLTVGGFHPAFQPPPLNLPQLRRLTLQLLEGNNPRLRLETYLAITSNTVQFGARLELYAGAGGFNVYGFLAFDVLFQFSPFYFIADVKAMLALRRGSSSIASISLSLTLEGPTPWKAKGTAKLKLFWFLTVKVRFSKTWGEERGTLLEDVAVLPQVVAALENRKNWKSELPSERHLLVSLRNVAPVDEAIVVHPLGGLSISQKVVPLNVPIDKFGERKPSDHREFVISDLRAGGDPIGTAEITNVREHFAPAQFFEKSDVEKLSADSFVQFDAGIALGVSTELESSHYVRREVRYEVTYRDSQRDAAVPTSGGFVLVDAVAFNTWAQNGAVARSPLSFAATGKSATAPDAVVLDQEHFAVANLSDLTLAVDGGDMRSEAEAFALLRRLVSQRPELAGRLQVVPDSEVNRQAA